MDVLQINNNHRIVGGSDTVYFNTGALLEAHGHNVSWFAGAHEKNQPCADERFFPAAADLSTRRPAELPKYFFNSAARRNMAALLDEKGAMDIAHAHIYYGLVTSSILKPLKARGVKFVQSLHEYKLACPVYTFERGGAICEDCVGGSTFQCVSNRCKDGSLVNSAIAWAEFQVSRWLGDVSLVDQFICVSGFQAGILARAGVPADKLTTLHNFVDPARLAPQQSGTRGDYLLYFGRIEELKGVATLTDAVAKTKTPLKVAGTGAWSETFKTRIADMDHVDYLGFVSGEPLRELVAGARAVVVPSEWYENCPMTVLEAKAVGTPVIGAAIGGIPELVRDGVDGFLFEAGNADSLAEALAKLEAADIDAFSAAAAQDVRERFSPDAHFAKLMTIYEQVLAGA